MRQPNEEFKIDGSEVQKKHLALPYECRNYRQIETKFMEVNNIIYEACIK